MNKFSSSYKLEQKAQTFISLVFILTLFCVLIFRNFIPFSYYYFFRNFLLSLSSLLFIYSKKYPNHNGASNIISVYCCAPLFKLFNTLFVRTVTASQKLNVNKIYLFIYKHTRCIARHKTASKTE